MYTIIVTRKSGAYAVATTDDENLLNVILSFCKDYSTSRKIEVFHPNHQTRDVYRWDSRGKFWTGQMGLTLKPYEEKS